MKRSEIRKKIIEMLRDSTKAGSRVGLNVKMIANEVQRYPYIEVFSPFEESETITHSVPHFHNELTITVEITNQAPYEAVQDDLDVICEQIRSTIERDVELDGLVDSIDLIGTKTGFDDDGAFSLGRAVMKFRVLYQYKRQEEW